MLHLFPHQLYWWMSSIAYLEPEELFGNHPWPTPVCLVSCKPHLESCWAASTRCVKRDTILCVCMHFLLVGKLILTITQLPFGQVHCNCLQYRIAHKSPTNWIGTLNFIFPLNVHCMKTLSQRPGVDWDSYNIHLLIIIPFIQFKTIKVSSPNTYVTYLNTS